jgi:GTPase SAR1 family protein
MIIAGKKHSDSLLSGLIENRIYDYNPEFKELADQPTAQHFHSSCEGRLTARGQALADEFGIKFFETSAKTNFNVEDVFFCIARDIKQRLAETDSKPEAPSIKINKPDPGKPAPGSQRSACCS